MDFKREIKFEYWVFFWSIHLYRTIVGLLLKAKSSNVRMVGQQFVLMMWIFRS